MNYTILSEDTLWLLKGDEHNVKESVLVGRVESKPLELVQGSTIKPEISRGYLEWRLGFGIDFQNLGFGINFRNMVLAFRIPDCRPLS